MAQDWDPDAALASLKLEADVNGAGTLEPSAKTSQRLFEENAPRAVLAIIHLATHSQNERIRLEASKVVVDRVLGRVADVRPAGEVDPFAAITQWLTTEAKSAAEASTS